MASTEENDSNDNVPHDLVLSILSKLPLKSLKRFTCVRKSWALLFDDPNFMSMYLHNFISNSHYDDNSYLILKKTGPSELIWISCERFGDKFNLDWLPPSKYPNRYFYLLGIGSGICGTLCICEPYRLDESAFLWNPATGESLIVPPSSFNPNVDSPFFNFKVLHLGFGYDHVRFDYKLIRCVYFIGENSDDDLVWDWDDCPDIHNDIWEIYSVRSNTWRTLDVDVDVAPRRGGEHGTQMYLNGVCHWLGETQREDFVKLLVSFDLSTEVVLTTPFPSHLNDSFLISHLGELNGSIALISYRRVDENTSFDISILGEIGVKKSWTKLYTFGPLPSFRALFGFGKKGDIFFIKNDGELACFNLNTQMIEEMRVHEESQTCQLMIYKESFLPIRAIHY